MGTEEECKFDAPLLYLPGRNRGRPPLTDKVRRSVWRESGYRCAMPLCRCPGVEVHHIVPWREALFRFGEAHPQINLIALCPACHARADNGQISRQCLADIKAQLLGESVRPPDDQAAWLDFLSIDDESFLLHLREWHRSFVYKGSQAQFRDYLSQLRRHLRTTGKLNSVKGVGVLAALGGVLRRHGSRDFAAARRVLKAAETIAKHLKKTRCVNPLVGRIYYDLGYIAFLQNDYHTSLTYLEQGRASDRDTGQEIGLLITDSVKALVAFRQRGHLYSEQLKRNLAAFSDSSHPDAQRWVSNSRIHLAEVCLATDDPDEALEYLIDTSGDYDTLGLVAGRGKILHLLGAAHLQRNELDRGVQALSASLASYQQHGVSEGFADVCYTYGMALEEGERWVEALQVYRLGLSADPGMDNITGIARCRSRIQVLDRLQIGDGTS